MECNDLVDVRKLLETPCLILRKKLIFRQHNLKVKNNSFVFEGKLGHH